ncbi:MAG: DegT/DnrJ/EryC1/StrS family aminotransferase [Candidatus Nanoarchaeia archaeon]
MKVPFGDLRRDERETKIDGRSIEEINKEKILTVIENKDFILGKGVEEFEKNFADYCGVKYCIGVGNGLSALELALKVNNIKPGDDVITVANTFNATVGAIIGVGANAILIDIDESNYNLDINQIQENTTKRTKAIIPVHLYGQPVDIRRLEQEILDILILEDSCQAHGAEFYSRKTGNLGNIAAFSFYPGKNLGCYGDGGAITTDDKEVAERIKKIRNYGQEKKYVHNDIPTNSRLDTIQAVVLDTKLKVLDRWNELRRKHAEEYNERLKDLEPVITPKENENVSHVYHLYVIRTQNRDELEKYLTENGISVGKHYPVPIHLQPCFKDLGYKKGDFPVTEKVSNEILSLPMFPTLKTDEIDYTCDKIKEFYKK